VSRGTSISPGEKKKTAHHNTGKSRLRGKWQGAGVKEKGGHKNLVKRRDAKVKSGQTQLT